MPRPVAAGTLTILGGMGIFAGGVLWALVGGLVLALFGVFSGLVFVGIIAGLLTILMGVLMLVAPVGHSAWGVGAIVLAVVSVPFALAGFFVGFFLALIGGLLAVTWRPPRTPPFVTVEGQVVGPPSV